MSGRGISFESFTPGALRAVRRAEGRARARAAAEVEPVDLIAALADEEEGRAAALLREFGLPPDRVAPVFRLAATDPGTDDEDDAPALPWSASSRAAVNQATARARAVTRGESVGTEHLLVGLLDPSGPIAAPLAAAGLGVEALLAQQAEAEADRTAPIAVEPDAAPLDLSEPGQEVDLARILDASANRAREGLRVVEDYTRFALDDPMLTRRLKDVRHRFAEAIRGLDPAMLLASRDTPNDVGTHIMTASEQVRENPRAVLAANFKRTAEALRSLEEYSKLLDPWVSGRFEVLRYDVYTLEKLVMTAATARRGLGDARLMVLVGGLPTLGDLTWVVGEALAGGADVIQLREKNLPDRVLLQRAREVRILTAQAGARFVMNDRPDLARLASADGVHLGQDDVSVRDARRIVGPATLVGVSTHERGQVEAAVLQAASYLGVGPVFPSTTKDFADLAGLEFVRQAAETTALPWFAIGGITAENLDPLIEAGARRIAVSAAVVRAEFPRQAAAALRARLDAAW